MPEARNACLLMVTCHLVMSHLCVTYETNSHIHCLVCSYNNLFLVAACIACMIGMIIDSPMI